MSCQDALAMKFSIALHNGVVEPILLPNHSVDPTNYINVYVIIKEYNDLNY